MSSTNTIIAVVLAGLLFLVLSINGLMLHSANESALALQNNIEHSLAVL